jgi:hypothetical protein
MRLHPALRGAFVARDGQRVIIDHIALASEPCEDLSLIAIKDKLRGGQLGSSLQRQG